MAAAKLERHYITYASPTCTNYHCKSCTCGTTTYTTAVTHLTSLKHTATLMQLQSLMQLQLMHTDATAKPNAAAQTYENSLQPGDNSR